MLTTATHDHKRGEDMRARLAVLSTDPATWVGHADRWMRLHADHEVVADDRYMLLQTLVGVWPVDGAADDLAER
ncbi:hypothetical protein NK942_24435, partial [Salmonella enterica subsp. enterica serovar Typhimurium]|nr:hypothetical protein [Salmonella enterica subsp. enterica serovar Typhimurium]